MGAPGGNHRFIMEGIERIYARPRTVGAQGDHRGTLPGALHDVRLETHTEVRR